MIKFNELGITRDGKNFVIDISVRDMPYYEDDEQNAHVYISSIYIVNQCQYKDTGSYKAEGNYVWKIEVKADDKLKNLRVVLTDREVCNLKDDLFFVVAEATGTPRSDTPCGMDEAFIIGVTYYQGPIYQRFMHIIREIERGCHIPKHFIDEFLRHKAIQYAIEAGHYALAAKYWNEFVKGKLDDHIVDTPKPCGCHGGLLS